MSTSTLPNVPMTCWRTFEIEKTPHDREQRAEATKRRARKRRRKGRGWLKAILITVILLFLIVGLAPTILSTRTGTSLIVSVINKGIRGRAEIGDLSLWWFGAIELQRFRLLDTSDREVLKANCLAASEIKLDGEKLLRLLAIGTSARSGERRSIFLERSGRHGKEQDQGQWHGDD